MRWLQRFKRLLFLLLVPSLCSAQESAPEVGSQVGGNLDAMSMLLSLTMVLALIIASAWLLKRFNLAKGTASSLKVITALNLSTKERLLVVEVAGQQLLIGVTSQQITLLKELEHPIPETNQSSAVTSQSILSAIQNSRQQQNSKQE